MRLALFRAGAILLFATLLQSCGGGGGDGGGGNNPPPPPDDDRIVIKSGNVFDVGILSLGPASNGLQTMQLLSSAALTLHQAVLVPQTLQCANDGIVELRAFDDDLDTRLSADDRVVVTYVDCSGADGTLSLDITRVTTDGDFVTLLEGAASLALDFSSGDLTGGGDMQFRLDSNEARWLGTTFSMVFSGGGQSDGLEGGRIEKVIANTNPLTYSLTISGTADSDGLGGGFDFSTTVAFAGIEGEWPDSGVLVAQGSSNSKATFQPGSENTAVAYRVGNGTFEETDWSTITSGILFGVGGDVEPPPPPPPEEDALGRRIDLGAAGEDLQTDPARGRIYVTVPERNELLVIAAQTLAVERRILVGSRPNAISMSLDGQELFVGLGGAGSIATVDLDTFALSRIVIAPTLQTSTVYDVVETSPGILFISSGDSSGSGVRLDRGTGIQTPIAAMDRVVSNKVELLADPPRGVVYVGDGWGFFPQNMKKLDATDPLAPEIIRSQHGSIGGTHRLSLDPTGARIYLQSGQVLSTADFSEVGQVSAGPSWAVDNGADVVVAQSPGTLIVHSAQTFQEVDRLTSDCVMNPIERIAPSPVDGQWLMLGGPTLCAVDIVHPDTRPGTGNPGKPANPPAQRNVPVVDMDFETATFDAEFDNSRNQLYVSLPDAGQIVTLRPGNQSVEFFDQDTYGNKPRGLDLSPDESTLAVMFQGNGHIGFLDVASGVMETRNLTPFLISPEGNDVAYINDTAIFATVSTINGTVGRVVRTNRLDASDTQVVADDRNMQDRVELAPSPDGRFLYVSNRISQLFKLDLAQPDAPILSETSQAAENEILGLDRMSIRPDGNFVADRFGQVLRTGKYTRAGEVTRGTPLYTRDGSAILIAHQDEPGLIERVDASSFVTTEQIHGNCAINFPRRLVANAAGDLLMTSGESHVCFWFLDEPLAQAAKIGPQSAHVCDARCLMRKQQRQSPVSLLRWRHSARP